MSTFKFKYAETSLFVMTIYIWDQFTIVLGGKVTCENNGVDFDH